jgi:hypothetical protein
VERNIQTERSGRFRLTVVLFVRGGHAFYLPGLMKLSKIGCSEIVQSLKNSASRLADAYNSFQ